MASEDDAVTAGAELKRFGYFIPKPNGTLDISVLNQIPSAKVLSEFHALVQVIFRVQPVVIALHIAENNMRDLVSAINDHRVHFESLDMPNLVSIETSVGGLIAASQGVTNFLASATSFLSLTEAQLRSGYGKDSAELAAWNARRRQLHAESFAYRFLYELRNFSQHRSVPISNFNVSGERHTETSEMKFAIGLEILRDSLFVEGFDWAKLKADLLQQPPKFQLMPLLGEFLEILQLLCLEAFQVETPALANCGRYLDVVKRKLAVPDDAVPVIFLEPSPGPGIPPGRYEVIPAAQLRWLLREYDELLNLAHPPDAK